MTTITREWLHQTIAEFQNTRDDIPFGLDDDDAKILKVLKQALASLGAKPVAWTDSDELEDARKGYSAYLFALDGEANKYADPRRKIMLYTAPPAKPVIPDEIIPDQNNSYEYVDGWNACRAEMLKAQQNEPQNIPENIPAQPVGELRARAIALYKPPFKFDFGYIWDADGQMVADQKLNEDGQILRVRGWGRISYLENPEALQDEVGEVIALALSDYWNLHIASAPSQNGKSASTELPNHSELSTNSPVIPDGWKLVPIEPTENMIIEGFESEPNKTFSKPEVWEEYAAMSGCKQAAYRAKLCWAAMLAAAPVQERE